MKSSLALEHGGVAAADLPDAAALFGQSGPFASVVLATQHDEADAVGRFDVSWRDRRRSLADRGAPDELMDRLGDWLSQARIDASGLACVAGEGGEVVGALGPAPTVDLAAWDSLPRVGTMIDWHQSSPSALLVTVDRAGADIFAAGPPESETGLVEVVESTVEDVDLRRSKPGGWSQHRYQQAAMENWRVNAAEVARSIDDAVDRIGARLVVIAGDDHAVGETIDQLGPRAAALVRRASGGRGRGSDGNLESDSRRWYRTAVAEDTVDLVDRFKQELGRRDRGAAGIDAVLDALRMAAVDTLLLHDHPLDDRRLFFRTSDRTSVGVREADLEGTDLVDGRLVDVLIRAAWGSGARVRMVPRLPELTDGVGAVLRFRTTD
jgi:hypothetical protein